MYIDNITNKSYSINGLSVEQSRAGVVLGTATFEDAEALDSWLVMMGFESEEPVSFGSVAPLHYSDVVMSDLETEQDCYDAIEAIEKHYDNYYGGLKAWYSGYNVEMKDSAKKKIDAIRKKLNKMAC